VTTSASSPPSPREEDLRLLFEAAPVPLVLTRRSDSALLMVNRAAALAFEVDPEGVLGMPAAGFYARPADRESFLAALSRDGRVERMELELKTAAGRHLWASVSASLIEYRGERAVLLGVANLTEQIEAARALRESEERFRALADNAPLGVYRHDLEGNCLYTNPRWSEITGFSAEEAKGHGWWRVVHPDDFAGAAAAFAQAMAGDGRYRHELRFVRPDRAVRWISILAGPLFGADGEVIGHVGSIDDVTERRRADEALREGYDFRNSVIQHAAEGLCVWHAVDEPPYVRFTLWNERMHDITGYTLDEINRLGWYQTLYPDPDVQARVKARMARSQEGEKFRALPSAIRRADGQTRIVQITTSRLQSGDGRGHVLALIEDVTEKQIAETALRESQQMLRLILDTIPVRVFWKDRNSVYRGCNHLVAADSGLRSVDEIVGKTDFDLGYKEAAEFQADDRRVMESGRPKVYYEEPVTTAQGRVIWARTSKFPLRGPGGEVVGVLGTFEDITDRKEVEEDIRRLNAELERRVADRTAQLTAANKELESFSYSVSHDLRAPLRAIDGFSQALAEDFGDLMDENARGHLHRVRLASQRMAELIDDILDLSRTARAELRRRRVSLSSLAEAIVAQLRASGPERTVEFVIEAGLEVYADESLSRVLLENLLGNAWKYTSRKPAARIEFGRTQQERGPAFFVRDDGDGFDMAYAHKLFGAFQRLHGLDEFEGTGIGLATVRRIVGRHGGKVWGEGQPGVGAVFYFSLGDEPARP